MTVQYTLHRLGYYEYHVSQLIYDRIPTDDAELISTVAGPLLSIQKLFVEHFNAQTRLKFCRDTGFPFVLFLRSFSSEHIGRSSGGTYIGQTFLDSGRFQDWIKLQINDEMIPIVKLHGGSDALVSCNDGYPSVLLTNSSNWEKVASELIEAASVIVFLITNMAAGVVEELDLIRKGNQRDRCLIILPKSNTTGKPAPEDRESIRSRLGDFPNAFEFDLDGDPTSYPENLRNTLTRLLHGAQTHALLKQALSMDFTYLEPDFISSDEFGIIEMINWQRLRLLRVMSEEINSYWRERSSGMDFLNLEFPGAWLFAHQAYGLAILTADFKAVREALTYLQFLYEWCGFDSAALEMPRIAARYGLIAKQIYKAGDPDTEERYALDPDPFKASTEMDYKTLLSLFLDIANSYNIYESSQYRIREG